MDLIPQHRALLGVDVVGSASNPGYNLNPIAEGVERLLSAALRNSGVAPKDATSWEPTGDGALLTFPSSVLGALLDSAQHLDIIASNRNRQYKPELRLRLAIEVGPVGDAPGFYASKIAVSRLLESVEFKKLVARCRDEGDDDSVNTALIVSDGAARTAFGGDHTSLVRRGDFASLTVQNKEYSDTAWVRVPGFDARSLQTFAKTSPNPPGQPSAPRVSNVAHGNMNGVQAETVNGGVTFGATPR